MKFIKLSIKKTIIVFFSIIGKYTGLKIDIFSDININKLIKSWRDRNFNKTFPTIINKSRIGNTSLGMGCKINEVICTGNIELGNFVSINGPATRLAAQVNQITIGSFTSIASNVVIQEHFHNKDRITSYYVFNNLFKEFSPDEIVSKGSIYIEEDVWIGSNSTILSGVTIGRGAVIGAGSVVTKDIPKYSIVVGNPARVIKKRFSDDIINELEKSNWWEMCPSELKKFSDLFNLNLNKSECIDEIQRLVR